MEETESYEPSASWTRRGMWACGAASAEAALEYFKSPQRPSAQRSTVWEGVDSALWPLSVRWLCNLEILGFVMFDLDALPDELIVIIVCFLGNRGLFDWQSAVSLGISSRRYKHLVSQSYVFCAEREKRPKHDDDYVDPYSLPIFVKATGHKRMPFSDGTHASFTAKRKHGGLLQPDVFFTFTFCALEMGEMHTITITVPVCVASFIKEVMKPAGWKDARKLAIYRHKHGSGSHLPPRQRVFLKDIKEVPMHVNTLGNPEYVYKKFGSDGALIETSIIPSPSGGWPLELSVECGLDHMGRGYERKVEGVDVRIHYAFPISHGPIRDKFDTETMNIGFSGQPIEFEFDGGLRPAAGWELGDNLNPDPKPDPKPDAGKRSRQQYETEEYEVEPWRASSEIIPDGQSRLAKAVARIAIVYCAHDLRQPNPYKGVQYKVPYNRRLSSLQTDRNGHLQPLPSGSEWPPRNMPSGYAVPIFTTPPASYLLQFAKAFPIEPAFPLPESYVPPDDMCKVHAIPTP